MDKQCDAQYIPRHLLLMDRNVVQSCYSVIVHKNDLRFIRDYIVARTVVIKPVQMGLIICGCAGDRRRRTSINFYVVSWL